MSREPATLIILAGGEAKRMGFPKHQLVVDGRRVLNVLHERLAPLFVETLIVGQDIEDLPTGTRLVEDLYNIRAALVGIHAGLTASTTDLTFVVACDMPLVEPALVEYLLNQTHGFDVVVPIVRGYHEPLCAAYRRTCLEPIEGLIEVNVLKVSDCFAHVTLRAVPEEELRQLDLKFHSFVNINHAE